MLHDGRMAGLVKLRRSDSQPGERQQWAERVDDVEVQEGQEPVKAGLTPDCVGDTTLRGGHRPCGSEGRNVLFHE